MNPSAFDTYTLDRYQAQAREKWGNTDAYKEFTQKTAHVSPQQMRSTGDGLMDIFAQLGQLRHLSPAALEVQDLIGQLQGYITEHYYTCTKQILKGLGQMYIAGDEMTANIDTAGGEGTARFAHLAIEEYCK